MSNMLLSRADKEKRVIELHKEGKSIREIAADVHMGFTDISAIIHKHFDEPEAVKKPTPSKFCAAVKLFKKGASLSDALIKLDLQQKAIIQGETISLSQKVLEALAVNPGMTLDKIAQTVGEKVSMIEPIIKSYTVIPHTPVAVDVHGHYDSPFYDITEWRFQIHRAITLE